MMDRISIWPAFQEGDFIKFSYYESGPVGRQLMDYSGYVGRVYKCGRFLLMGNNDSSVGIFERISVRNLEVKTS